MCNNMCQEVTQSIETFVQQSAIYQREYESMCHMLKQNALVEDSSTWILNSEFPDIYTS